MSDVLCDLIDKALNERLPGAIRAELAKSTPPSDYMSCREAAALARVSMGTMRRWIRSKRLPACTVGRKHRVRRGDLEALIRGETATAGIYESPEQWAKRTIAARRSRGC